MAKKQKPKRTPFEKAKRRADSAGETLCATVDHDGKPIYFTMPADTDVQEVADAAFLARYGHLPTEGERFLMQMAKRRMERTRNG